MFALVDPRLNPIPSESAGISRLGVYFVELHGGYVSEWTRILLTLCTRFLQNGAFISYTLKKITRTTRRGLGYVFDLKGIMATRYGREGLVLRETLIANASTRLLQNVKILEVGLRLLGIRAR